ncbi:MAG: hypothetical protein WC822_02445 [Candidatus Paceibacterota bacterium]
MPRRREPKTASQYASPQAEDSPSDGDIRKGMRRALPANGAGDGGSHLISARRHPHDRQTQGGSMSIGRCKCGGLANVADKRYKQDICTACYQRRRLEATKVGDSEWFEANVPLSLMTEAERTATGL